jgi:aryl-alcohol dehydrogenase-like predicted oxidoreductase
MESLCRDRGIALLTYGTLLGGFLSETWLGRAEPGWAELGTASLRKYKNMIDAWGGWTLFQELLAALQPVAQKHGAGIANIGSRMILDRPAVAGVIIGARLGVAEHIADNARTIALVLDAEDAACLAPVLAQSRDLLRAIGDCGDEYR